MADTISVRMRGLRQTVPRQAGPTEPHGSVPALPDRDDGQGAAAGPNGRRVEMFGSGRRRAARPGPRETVVLGRHLRARPPPAGAQDAHPGGAGGAPPAHGARNPQAGDAARCTGRRPRAKSSRCRAAKQRRAADRLWGGRRRRDYLPRDPAVVMWCETGRRRRDPGTWRAVRGADQDRPAHGDECGENGPRNPWRSLPRRRRRPRLRRRPMEAVSEGPASQRRERGDGLRTDRHQGVLQRRR